MHFTLRRATTCDADASKKRVASASFRLLTFLPIGQLLPKCGAGHFLRRLRRAVGTGDEGCIGRAMCRKTDAGSAPGWSLAYS